MKTPPTVIVKNMGTHSPESQAPEGISLPVSVLLQECGYDGKYTLEVLAARIPRQTVGISLVSIAHGKIELIVKPRGAETGRRCFLIVPKESLDSMFNTLSKYCKRASKSGELMPGVLAGPPRLSLLMMKHSPENTVMRDVCDYARQIFSKTGYADLSDMQSLFQAILGPNYEKPMAIIRLQRDLLSSGLLEKKRYRFLSYHFVLSDIGIQEFGLTKEMVELNPIVPINLETIVENRDTNEAINNFRNLCKRVERYRYITARRNQISEAILRLEQEIASLLQEAEESNLQESVQEYERICGVGKL